MFLLSTGLGPGDWWDISWVKVLSEQDQSSNLKLFEGFVRILLLPTRREKRFCIQTIKVIFVSKLSNYSLQKLFSVDQALKLVLVKSP